MISRDLNSPLTDRNYQALVETKKVLNKCMFGMFLKSFIAPISSLINILRVAQILNPITAESCPDRVRKIWKFYPHNYKLQQKRIKVKINPKFLSDGGFRYEYIGHSYKELTKIKYFTLRSFIAQEKYRKQNKNKIKKIKKLINLYHGPALVLANGPSLVNISENIIKEFSKNKALFTINNFFNIKFKHSIIPTYHFICDNAYWNISDKAKVDYRDKVKKLQTINDMVLVQPDHQTDYLNKNTLYIRKNPLTGFTKSIDITKVNGLPNYTSYFAIATAIYLGYSPIYVAGLDLNYYKFIDYNNDLGWVLKSHHSYNSDLDSIDSWQYRDTLLRILNSNMSMIYYLKLFEKYDVRIVADQRVSTSLNNTSISEFNNYLM